MQIRELKIGGAFEITPKQFTDPRGTFFEAYRSDHFEEAVGHRLDLQQTNSSVSAAGVVRGIHFAELPPSQAKYVWCPRGALLDVVVDIRVGSPTYGQWDTVLLDDVDRRAIYVGEGLGHAFCSLEDGSTAVYMCSTRYAPGREHGIHPFDPEIGIEWPSTDRSGNPMELLLSEKDAAAPSLAEVAAQGLLPTAQEAADFYASLR